MIFLGNPRGGNEAAPAAHEVSAARGTSRERAPDKTGVRKREGKEKEAARGLDAAAPGK